MRADNETVDELRKRAGLDDLDPYPSSRPCFVDRTERRCYSCRNRFYVWGEPQRECAKCGALWDTRPGDQWPRVVGKPFPRLVFEVPGGLRVEYVRLVIEYRR